MDNSSINYCLSWDAVSGKSVLYYWSSDDANWISVANNLPENPISGATGKIMLRPYMDNNNYNYCMAWDMSTGKSLLYYYSFDTYRWEPVSVNLPENPVPGATGNIMIEPYMDNNGTSYFMAWEVTTGKSTLYYWNSDTYVWDAAQVNLPSSPIPGASGKIMIKPYIDNYGIAYSLVWDSESGKSLLYYWDSETYTWKVAEINLPPAPVPGSGGTILLEPYMDNNGYNYCLAVSENTGKSVLYVWNGETHTWNPGTINPPDKPIPGATGKTMIIPYMDNNGITYCLAWDKSSGKSILYYWDSETSTWDAASINLPENPVGN